jgi:transposase-like protein
MSETKSGGAAQEWTPPRRRRWDEAAGRAMVAALRQSGESACAFAKRHGLDENRVHRWVKRLVVAPAAPSAPSVAAVSTAPPSCMAIPFAPVRLVAAAEERAGALDVVVGGAVVRVHRDFDADLFRRVIAALEEAAC